MSKSLSQKRIEQLKKAINHYRYVYHVLDKSEISDAALDSLKHELYTLEQEHPDLITADSPTQRIGGEPLKEFKKINHPQPILSIEDIFTFEELKDWEEYLTQYLPADAKIDYFCERKIDGIDIVLTYKKGILITAATRGNGLIGEDVTQNIKTIEAIPLKLEKEIDLEVRGEIFMRQHDFVNLNKEQKKKGLAIFANARNLTAGTIRQLDPKIVAKRKLDCFAFEILNDLGQKTHQKVHELLKNLGFKIDQANHYVGNKNLCSSIEEVEHLHELWYKERDKADFEYDGMVVVVNQIAQQKILGTIGKTPRWMRAYKFPAEQAISVIENIIIQVGRTGVLSPVAVLKPTQVMGSTVSRATLHNEDQIKRLDARIGDTVIIEKAGDVIPAVVKVLKEMRTGKEKIFHFPVNCPFCNSKTVRVLGEVAHRCLNKNCFAIRLENFIHFVSKAGFNIDGLGEKIVEQLLNKGLIKEVSDIFKLKKEDLENLERFAEKSAQNLIEAIEKSKKIPLGRFIFALGIRHVGEETALLMQKKIIEEQEEKYKGKKLDLSLAIKILKQIKNQDWENVREIGPKVAQSISAYFSEQKNIKILEELVDLNIEIEILKHQAGFNKLKNQSFVLTGSLETMSRDKAKTKIRVLGGDIASAVSKKTNYLVAGADPGSKYTQAKKMGVRIINEKEFLEMIG